MILDHRYTVSDEDAVERLRALADYWDAKHGVKARWEGHVAHFDGKVMGVRFSGAVSITGGNVHADVKAGFLAEKLGAKAYVQRKLTDYLDPATSLEELRSRIPR
ncbi:MAG: polyhydroxyalkanoic acid system family protein [Myxococcales bacterium]|nr:polyhydroxyalkanoic acid system family protein [Myxococcales bacterium]